MIEQHMNILKASQVSVRPYGFLDKNRDDVIEEHINILKASQVSDQTLWIPR